jgi:hypothetical protein
LQNKKQVVELMNNNETNDNQNFKFLNQNESDYYDKRIKKFLDEKDVGSLIDVLENDLDSTTCLEAAEALAKLGDERGVDYLIAAMESEDTSINWEAEAILSELNIPKGVLALHNHMLRNNRTIYSQNNYVKETNYIWAFVIFIFVGFVVSLLLDFLPVPGLISLLLNLITGYYVFRFAVKSQVVDI